MITVICSNCDYVMEKKEGEIEDPDLPNISHSICEDCLVVLYPEQAKIILAEKEELENG